MVASSGKGGEGNAKETDPIWFRYIEHLPRGVMLLL